MSESPMSRPGEVAGRPKLTVSYRTDPDKLAALLPPGLESIGEPIVQIGIYCVPVHGEPEFGVSTKVPASYNGIAGHYCLGIGIDQESAIFISRETNGQPKFPCSVRFFRMGDRVSASCTHLGTTFLSYEGVSAAAESSSEVGSSDGSPSEEAGSDVEQNEWWLKYSRAVGGVERAYDFAPHVVRVRTVGRTIHTEPLAGELTLRESAWDPYTSLLPMVEPAKAALVTNRFSVRDITLEGPLDPDAFWPFADTIGGSRWPGAGGCPRPQDVGGER